MIVIRVIAAAAFALLASCGGVVGDDEDAAADTDEEDVSADLGDVPGDSGSDVDGDTPAGDTAGEPDAEDAAPDPVEDPTTEPGCGNGTVEAGEECDDGSDFCVDCELVAPSGWVGCTDSGGDPAFLFIEDWAGAHTQLEYRDHCEAMIEGMGGPAGYRFYGLAVLADRDVWDCIEPSLDGRESYYVGLTQDTGASDYSEPDGGWTWMANDGSGETGVAPFDPVAGPIAGELNDAGGSGNVECGRIESTGGGWTYRDYSCDDPQGWLGICMIQY
jgi:hypothetical protein